MGFYDDASLIFLAGAEAGKDGKAYSVKPTDGEGDFTFSRGSNLAATRVGADGLIEKGRENLLLQSNTFSNASWLKELGASVTGNQSGYNGSSDAWQLDTDGTQYSRLRQVVSGSGVQTFSLYAKAGTLDWIGLYNGGGSGAAFFDLTNGVTGNLSSSNIDASITSVGGGWYRCEYSFNESITDFRIYPTGANGTFTTTAGNIYIQDAQLEIGLAATDVIESGATTGKAGLLEDEPRFDYSGGATCPSLLLEPSRTNLAQYSEAFSQWNSNLGSPVVTDNFATSPEGLQNATKITFPTTGDAVTDVYGGVTTGTNLVFSIYVKNIDASFTEIRVRNSITDFESRVNWTGSQITSVTTIDGTLEYEAVGNDWYRIWGAYTNDDTNQRPRLYSNGANDSYLVWGAQLEAGSYPTSYIPNHSGGSVTRGAEGSSVTGASSLIGQTEGTILCEFKIDELDYNVDILGINNSTNSEYIAIFKYSSNVLRSRIRTNSISNTIDHSITATGNYKVALKYNASTLALFINGVKINEIAATISFASTIERIFVGPALYVGLGKAKYGQLLTLTEALSDADCIALTT